MRKNISIIACVLVVSLLATLMITGCTPNTTDVEIVTYKGADGLDYFSDEASVLQYLRDAAKTDADRLMPYYLLGIPNDLLSKTRVVAEDVAVPEREISETNLQQEGIDEGDILKTDGDFIYIIRDGKFVCVDVRKEMPQIASETALTGMASQMYIKGDRAIIVSYEYRDTTSIGAELVDTILLGGSYYSKIITTVSIYDISDRYNVKSVRTYDVEGSAIGTRESDGKLYLVTNKYLGIYRTFIYDRIVPYVCDSIFGDRKIDATEIAMSTTEQPATNIMTISVIDWADDTKEAEISNILGGGADIYMTENNLYILQNVYATEEHQKTNEKGESVTSYYSKWSTNVAKYDISDGIRYVGNVDVPGFTSSDFAYSEYDGKFRIATTEYTNEAEYVNSVYVYDGKLQLTGKLTGIAPTEKVYGARFDKNILYLVTFRQVDPLFIIDLSGKNPVITGELEIPGFSTYMHSVGDGLLLGIGKSTEDEEYGDSVITRSMGVKLSLFDVSDGGKPVELDVVNNLGGNNSYSLTENEYKAFVWSEERKEGYFPIYRYLYELKSGERVDYSQIEKLPDGEYDPIVSEGEYLAFVRVAINDGKLDVSFVDESITFSYINSRWLSYYYDARICFADNDLYLYSGSFLKKFDRTTFEKLQQLDFED